MAYYVAVVQNALTHNYLYYNTKTRVLGFQNNQHSADNFILQDTLKKRELKVFSSDLYLTVKGDTFTVDSSSDGLETDTTPSNGSSNLMIYLQDTQDSGGEKHYIRINTRVHNKLEVVDQTYVNKVTAQDSAYSRQELEFNLVLVEAKDLHK